MKILTLLDAKCGSVLTTLRHRLNDLTRGFYPASAQVSDSSSGISDLIPKVHIPVLVLEKDNEALAYFGEDASGDSFTPEQILETAAFEQLMQTQGLGKVEMDSCEITELDFSRIDRIAEAFG